MLIAQNVTHTHWSHGNKQIILIRYGNTKVYSLYSIYIYKKGIEIFHLNLLLFCKTIEIVYRQIIFSV